MFAFSLLDDSLSNLIVLYTVIFLCEVVAAVGLVRMMQQPKSPKLINTSRSRQHVRRLQEQDEFGTFNTNFFNRNTTLGLSKVASEPLLGTHLQLSTRVSSNYRKKPLFTMDEHMHNGNSARTGTGVENPQQVAYTESASESSSESGGFYSD
jgi:hypothetical protein